MEQIKTLAQQAKKASYILPAMGEAEKNNILQAIAHSLRENAGIIIKENTIDLEQGIQKGMTEAMQDRLMLSEKRIDEMAKGMESLMALKDPIGEVLGRMEKAERGF